MASKTISITEKELGKRTDRLIADKFPEYPRAALHRLFLGGYILLNDKVTKPGLKVRLGDKLKVDLSPLKIKIADIDLPVLYEDDDVIVIDKPAGVISHARGRYFDEPSVASFVRQRVAELTGDRAGIVHRLDRATSGVMICAKNTDALSWLQTQFSERRTTKTYQAIIQGKLSTESGLIDMPILRNPKIPKTFMVSPDGKPAQTRFITLKCNDRYSLVELKPETGRTHQLRVHLKELRHPIVGDELYGGEDAGRLMLHAKSLGITLPSGDEKIFTSPSPKEFDRYF